MFQQKNQKTIIGLTVLVLAIAAVIEGTTAKESASSPNPYISYDGILVDVNKINDSIVPEFSKVIPEETDYFIVKFKSEILQSWRNEIEKLGGKVLWYIPYNSYIVKMKRNQAELIKGLPYIYWVGVQQPYLKLSKLARELLQTKDYKRAVIDDKIRLTVVLYGGEVSDRVKATIKDASLGRIVNEVVHPHNTRIWIDINPKDYAEVVRLLANIKEVEGIEIFQKVLLNNDAGRWVHQRFVSGSYPLYTNNLRGQGQIGGISDSGFDYDMCYYRDTSLGPPPFDNQAPWGDVAENPSMRKIIIYYSMDATTCGTAGSPGTGSSGNDHGTHTSTTFIGDNFATACGTGTGDSGDGMALCSKVVMEDLGANLEFINNPCGTVYDVLSIAYADGARVHTNSWGYGCGAAGCPCDGNFYGADARDVDQFVWTNKDMAIFFSAGNSASDCPDSTVGAPSVAKNCSSIGATLHGTSATSIASYSSEGWSYDKRMKPDFTCQGSSVVSANNDGNNNSNNCGTLTMSGTSMACPTCAGYGLLTRQYYVDGYYPTGAPVPSNGFIPSAALIKATMVNGSVDMTGVTGQPPNITEGWGRLQLDESLYFTGDTRRLWVADNTSGFTTGMSRCYYIQNNSTTQTLKATLVWSDYPAALNANPALVNDLMLEATDPANSTNYHLTLDASYNIVQTTNDALPQDNRNTTEQLSISSAATGIWKIKVKGINIPQAPQPYALVVTGDVADTTQPAAPTGVSASATADNQITVSWSAATGAVCYNVYRSFGACPGTTFEKIANCVSSTSYVDNSVSGGSTYAYKVTAIYAASCESDFSSCAQATATGICTLAPTFSGIVSVSNDKQSTCSLTAQWNAATSNCPTFPNIRYTIYRSTDPNFDPGPTNQLATCLTGTSYTDNSVTVGTTYYYAVRAEDSRSGGGSGPCNGGNFETNVVKASNAPTGPETVLFSDNAGDTGSAQMSLGTQWNISTARNHTPGGTRSYYSGTGQNLLCSYLTSPSISLTGGAYYFLEFWTTYNLEEGWDFVDVQVSNNGGTSYTVVTPRQGYPSSTNGSTNSCSGWRNQPVFSGNVLPNWYFYDVDLGTYAGQNILFRFRFGSDDGVNLENWYGDDMRVIALASCTTGGAAPGRVENTLYVSKSSGNPQLTWTSPGAPCQTTAYGIYRGSLPWAGYNHSSIECNSAGSPYTDLNATGSYYYLVVAQNSGKEGSYGKDSSGAERPAATTPCLPQQIGTCN